MTADPADISVTAKVSAYYRKFSDIAFAAEVAALIGADEAFAEIVRNHGLEHDKLTFYAPMFEARYKSITQLIRTSGASQVLELACGYSLRGLDLTRDGSLRYVETDLPHVVATKLHLLDELRKRHAIAPSPSHVVATANALELEELRAATAGLDRSRPLLILCEGLIGYLTREETARIADNVRTLLGEFKGGWWIVPDFAFKTELRNLPPERIRLREAITGVTQRELDASAFEDADDLAAFLGRFGFEVQVRSQIDETPSFSTIAALGLSPAVIDRLRPALRVWLMIAVAALLVAGCGRKKDGGGAGSAREEPRAAIAAKQPADPNVIFRDDKGREIKREDLKDVSGAVEWELVGGDHVPEAAQTLHEQARAAGSSGDYPKAIALFKQAHDAAPAWPYPLYELGFTYELMGEPVKALAEYERVIALAPRGYFTVLASADCLRREAAKEWASGLCKRYALAEFMFGDERTAELKAIAVAAPRMPGPQKDLALDIRDDAQRLAAIDKALGVSPDPETRGVLLSNKGLTLASLGRKDEAIAVLGALVLDPASPLDVIEMSKMGLVQLTTPQRP